VLGVDDRHVWVLTAAHCVGGGHRNYHINTPTIAASGWSRVYWPPGWAGGIAWDIALVSIPMPVAPQWNAMTKPLIYDGSAEINRAVHLVGHGRQGVGQASVGVPGGRWWGTTRIVGSFAGGTGIVSGYTAHGPTDLQARTAPGDSGSAAWQQHAGGYWTIIGVTSTGNEGGTNYTRMNRHVEWIKGVFPGATKFSERFRVTDTHSFVSRVHGEDVGYTKLHYVVAPGQPNVQGTTGMLASGAITWNARIKLKAKDALTGSERSIHLRTTHDTGCVGSRGTICRPDRNDTPLKVSYHAADNAGLPSGEWKTNFDVDATGLQRAYKERLPISVEVRNIVQGRVTKTVSWQSPNFAQAASRGTVYYIVPAQAGATGPASGVWGGQPGHATVKVLVKDASTGFERHLSLRATRSSGCGAHPMNDGAQCNDYKQGPLTVSFHAADNTDLPTGTWRGVAHVRAKGWHDHAIDEAIRVNVDIEQQ
jgi:hypothetical protein